MTKEHREHVIYETEDERLVCNGKVYSEFNEMSLCERREKDIKILQGKDDY